MPQHLTLSASPAASGDVSAQSRASETPLAADHPAEHSEAPGVLDTYAVLYALSLVFLVPGALSIANLPFRDYTFAYVSLVTVPFLLGLLVTLFTDSRDSLKTLLLRARFWSPSFS